jgi:antibiotic biosynthesis monooxygenase (ABM) superfamily enzyme
MTNQKDGHPAQHIGGIIMVVMMDVEPEHEAEFNRWYNQEHLVERLEIPGYVSARRFKLEEGSGGVLKYLCIWELDDSSPLQSAEMKAQRLRPSELRDRVYHYITQRARGVYRQIYPEVGSFEDHSGFHPERQQV